MNTEELAIITEVRDEIERMLAESGQRSQSLAELKRIVQDIEYELAGLEARVARLERPCAF